MDFGRPTFRRSSADIVEHEREAEAEEAAACRTKRGWLLKIKEARDAPTQPNRRSEVSGGGGERSGSGMLDGRAVMRGAQSGA